MATHEHIYTDESGTHADARYCLIAGYRGSPGQWRRFNQEWRRVLAEHRVENAFHADPFWNRKHWSRSESNQFVDWSEKRAVALMDDIVEIIRSHRIHALGGAVPVADFKALSYQDQCLLVNYVPPHLIPELKRVRIRNPEPYMLAHLMLMTAALNESSTTLFHFKIARHQQYGPRAEEAWRALKSALSGADESRARQMQGIEQLEPSSTPALQAADLLAYLWFRSMQLGGDRFMPPRERSAFQVIRRKDNALHWGGSEHLQMLLNVHDPEVRAHFQSIRPPKTWNPAR